MTYRSVLILTAGFAGLTACAAQPPAVMRQTALATDLGPSGRAPARMVPAGRAPARAIPAAAPMPLATARDATMTLDDAPAGTPATGVVNSADAARRRLNISHGPIPAIGWPSMTMDFPVAASVDMSAAKPGARVTFRIREGAGGMYEITSLRAAGN